MSGATVRVRQRGLRKGRRARWAAALLTLVLVVVVLIVLLRGGSSPTTGYDISYPQCSASYPSHPLFGIVGVNGGLASNANPCLGDELHWAHGAPGQKRPEQPPVSLYIDTANPGAHHVADWPSGGTTPLYSSCNGELTNACSYLYGKQRAAHSYRLAASTSTAVALARTAALVRLDRRAPRRAGPGTYLQLNCIAASPGFRPADALRWQPAR